MVYLYYQRGDRSEKKENKIKRVGQRFTNNYIIL